MISKSNSDTATQALPRLLQVRNLSTSTTGPTSFARILWWRTLHMLQLIHHVICCTWWSMMTISRISFLPSLYWVSHSIWVVSTGDPDFFPLLHMYVMLCNYTTSILCMSILINCIILINNIPLGWSYARAASPLHLQKVSWRLLNFHAS